MLFIGSFESAKSYVPSIRKSELQEMKGTTVKYKIYLISVPLKWDELNN